MLGRKRGAQRVGVNHEFGSLQEFISEYVSDISNSGVFVRTENPLPVGTQVDLRFTVIADDLETVEGQGTVVRVVAPGAGPAPGMGVSFDWLTPESEEVVKRLAARGRTGS
jgi:uncharacterized protein (TIGR02266 family)